MITFVNQVESVIKEGTDLTPLIEAHHHFLSNFQNPAWVEKFSELTQRSVTTRLLEYAEEFRLPRELMSLVVDRFVQRQGFKEAAAFRLASKETNRMAKQAYRGPLGEIGIATPELAIQFAKEVGPQLSYLDISKISFKPEQLRELLEALPLLKVLIARECNRVDTQTVAALKNLQSLDLYGTAIGDAAIQALTGLKNLQSLNLASTGITSIGVKALAASSDLTLLKELRLANNFGVKNAGAQAIATSQTLNNLQLLDLESNHLTEEGAIAIVTSPYLKNLQYLNLGFSHIGNAAIAAITSSQNLLNLKGLILAGDPIGDAGAIAIARSQILKNLEILILMGNGIGDDGAEALAQSQTLEKLHSLNLIHNPIGDDQLTAIAMSQNLKSLKNLNGSSLKYSQRVLS